MKRYIYAMAMIVMIGAMVNVGWGQQVIGSYPSMDGGFENQSGTLATASPINSEQTAWTTQRAGTGVISNTGGRSGPKYVQYTQNGTTHKRLQSPTANVTAVSHVVQFFYQGDMDGTVGGDIRGVVSAVGTTSPYYGSYIIAPNTGPTWTKYTAVETTKGTPAFGIGIVDVINTGLFYIDDFVVYPDSAVDETAPNSPTGVTIANETASTLDISWTAPDGGVDGGGYVVVRYSQSPDANDDPNQNGIYAVDNTFTVTNTGTIAYIGTNISFTDDGLSTGTAYYYKVYAVDKAFNYSIEASGSGTTSAGATPTITLNTSSFNGSFGTIVIGNSSSSSSFTVSGADLTNNITVTPPTGFEIRKGSDSFSTSPITLTHSGGTVNETTIDIRFTPLSAQAYSGNVACTSSGATGQNAPVTGTGIKSEPSNHPTSFSAMTGTIAYSAITVTWADATSGTVPDYYLIKGSAVGFGSISDPVDGTAESDAALIKNIAQGTQTASFSGLSSNTTYYFKIFPYANSGTNINYKTDGTVPTTSQTTAAVQSLPLTEDFNYTAGEYLNDHGWYPHSGTGEAEITVASSGLTYSGYPGSGTGNSALLDSTGEDIHLPFTTTTSGNLFVSFLVNVTTIADGYFLHLGTGISSFAARVFIKSSAGSIQFGLSNTSSTSSYSSADYSTGTTYLCIIKYEVSTTGNASIWVFSSGVPGDESSAGTALLTTSGTGQSTISGIYLRQYNSSQNITVDGIRIATSWGDMSLPVSLTSFTAQPSGNAVALAWRTESETENLGFILEKRLQVTGNWLPVADYTTCEALAGHGSTSEAHSYRYTDAGVQPGATYFYRLGDVDYSGKVTWHKEVEVKVEVEDVPVPLIFGLKPAYPNPFNPSLTIPYGLTEDGQMSLKVYNLRGALVEELISTYALKGTYSLNWQPQNLSAGIYIVRMQSGNHTSMQKVVFVK